ncbi:MAG: DNA polymerase/3'-5' exonuclease PolX [Gemmatimonadaceae bacterium]|nr:DNA polymerase/3'-5' exonuclease PolX [Gemmatimonadaceae bacterium]
MDSRTAAHVLSSIGALLDLSGSPGFKPRAYQNAARAVLALGADDLAPLLESGELLATPGIGPATLSVIRELIETEESSYLARLSEATPPGLLQMVRVPGLGPAKVHFIHQELGIESLDELEDAARDGRLEKLRGFGPKTARRILDGIPFARNAGELTLYHHGLHQAVLLREAVSRHPDVTEAIIAGSVRRHMEVVGEIDIVAVCNAHPVEVAHSFANMASVREVNGEGATLVIRYVDNVRMRLVCAAADNAGFMLWRATGSEAHVAQLRDLAARNGITLAEDGIFDPFGGALALTSEEALFETIGLDVIPPELREGSGEIEAAAAHTLPELLLSSDICGALHCHSTWSDGGATIEEMASAAQARGWSYIGITDHSESAFYASGMKRDKVLKQHAEIDELNSRMKGFRILKGIEADILADGSVDYDDETRGTFDFVVGSVHSRFGMTGAAMTDRILTAMDDPRLTILGHPTGRLLLSRSGYDLDIAAVIEKAAGTGTVLELNADPHRLDLDWRHCRAAKEHGVLIEIGPDAHSERGLDTMDIGVGLARKAWLGRNDVLNAKPVEEVLAVAAKKRGAMKRGAD